MANKPQRPIAVFFLGLAWLFAGWRADRALAAGDRWIDVAEAWRRRRDAIEARMRRAERGE